MRRILILALVVLSAAAVLALSGCSQQSINLQPFAQCLTEKDVTMFGTTWCSHCQAQKELFGSSFEEVHFVDCDARPGECQQNGVEAYPTWKINNTSYLGEQSLERLAFLSGCNLPAQ
ncbi:hypothetical protein JW826_00610 [Candidatus Woesearchaeota archaeon]|nr:hypothetical protein [Candidatus Woesearchaeota archaeon]